MTTQTRTLTEVHVALWQMVGNRNQFVFTPDKGQRLRLNLRASAKTGALVGSNASPLTVARDTLQSLLAESPFLLHRISYTATKAKVTFPSEHVIALSLVFTLAVNGGMEFNLPVTILENMPVAVPMGITAQANSLSTFLSDMQGTVRGVEFSYTTD